MKTETVLTVMCVYCKEKRRLTSAEVQELNESNRVAMCQCGGVMVAHSAKTTKVEP